MKSHFILPSLTLLKRELVRFFRQKNRVIGALATPLMFWILLGAGLSSSFHPPSMDPSMTASEYFFPGTVTLIILFTSIFSTISIIEDRREGFLQSVLVAPISKGSIVFGKILGGTSIAVLQGILFLALAGKAGIHLNLESFFETVGIMILMGFALTGLGFVIAWRMDSTMGFHAIMNLFLMPMWLLSGALFPMTGVPQLLQWIMKINPLTYGVAALRQVLYGSNLVSPELPSLSMAVIITIVFGCFFFGISFIMVGTHKTPQS
jgi:ABC-2 type transport system permease protein